MILSSIGRYKCYLSQKKLKIENFGVRFGKYFVILHTIRYLTYGYDFRTKAHQRQKDTLYVTA